MAYLLELFIGIVTVVEGGQVIANISQCQCPHRDGQPEGKLAIGEKNQHCTGTVVSGDVQFG